MAKIDSFNFGFIVVDGKQYVYDVVILPDGAVKEREPSRRRLGGHSITSTEIENLVQAKPEVIVVGTGTSGQAKFSEDAEIYILQASLNMEVMLSSQAIEKFNELVEARKQVAALIHITC